MIIDLRNKTLGIHTLEIQQSLFMTFSEVVLYLSFTLKQVQIIHKIFIQFAQFMLKQGFT